MEDRYLFKAERLDNGEWVQGALFNGESHCIIGQEIKFSPYTEHECKIAGYEVDRDTICQCTGLKDTDGKLIWENDIVAYLDTYSTESGYAEADCIGKVVWDAETISFQVTNRLSAESWEVLDDECSVVGNAIDNQELLGVGL